MTETNTNAAAQQPKLQNCFSKNHSAVLKGIAILAMLWHHCFLEGRFEEYSVSCFPLSQQGLIEAANFCKFCVSIFAFISGFGLYLSYKKHISAGAGKQDGRWYRTRYIRTFSGYWLIVVLLQIYGATLGHLTADTYFAGGTLRDIPAGVLYMLLDLLGLSRLFDAPTLIGTWWYMSAAFVFIILTPLLFRCMERFGGIPVILLSLVIPHITGAYPGGTAPYAYIPVFVIGMAFAENKWFDRLEAFIQEKPLHRIAVIAGCLAGTVLCFVLVNTLPIESFWDVEWALFPVIYILLIYCTLARIPGIRQCLAFLGKHSANMYLLHNFLRTHFAKYVYSGHFLFVLLKLLAASLVLSLVLELMKKLIHYQKFADWLCTAGGRKLPSEQKAASD